MNPLLFGPPARRLFGLYHLPEGDTRSDSAVLLCPPLGHEALRSHRFYRLLAIRLARRGVAVLRFDPHGTGNSPGADEDVDLNGWRVDIGEAHRELQARSGARRLIWFGARIGGTLALQAAQGVAPAGKLVLWEPVLHGPSYLQELRERHVNELELSHSIPNAGWRRALHNDSQAFTDQAMGFALSPLLRRQIAALSPDALPVVPGVEHVVIAKPGDATTCQWVAGRSAAHNARLVPLSHSLIWMSNPFANNEMVPAEALQRVLEEIHG